MENYYSDVLSLSVERFESDISKLDAILEKKNNEWNSSSNTTIRANSDKYYKSGAVRAVYTDAAKWKKQYDEAKKKVDGDIRLKINILSGKGYMEEAEIKKLADKAHVSPQYIKNFVSEMKVEIGNASKTAAKPAYNKKKDDYKPETTLVFQEPEKNLALINCSDYYDFLNNYTKKINVSSGVIFSEDTEVSKCVEAAKKIEAAWVSKKTDSEKSAVDKICTAIEDFDKSGSKASKANYDKYLTWKRLNAILNTLWTTLAMADENSRIIDEKHKEENISEITEILANRADAESVLMNFCKEKKITVKETVVGRVVCPFCNNSFEKVNGKIPDSCPSCHKSFLLECPECHKMVNYAETRKCGTFNLDIYPRVVKKCREARDYVDKLYFDYAEQQLSEIDRMWPNFSEAKQVRDELNSRKKLVGNSAATLSKHIQGKNFYSALSEYNNLKRAFSGYSDPVLEERINNAVNEAKKLYSSANIENDNAKKIKLLIRVKQCVNDYPGIDSALEKIPPEPIKFVKAIVNQNNKSITVQWDSNDEDGTVEYVLLRKEDGKPVSFNDGEQLIKTTAKGYTDHSTMPGRLYYYAVYAERGKKSALMISDNAEIVYPSIENYNSEVNETMVQTSWNVDTGSMKVEVYRCASPAAVGYGEGVRVIDADNNGFVDVKLETGKDYYYNIFFVMASNGKRFVSDAFSIHCKTIKKGKPVAIEISDTPSKGTYNISVTEGKDNDGIIQFYFSNTDSIASGTSVEAKQLASMGLSYVNVTEIPGGQYRFDLKEGEAKYVYAVNVNGSAAVIWQSQYVENFRSVEIKSMRNDGVNLFIELEAWPDKYETIFVVHSCEKQPMLIDEPNSFKQVVKRLDYKNSNIRIQNIEQKDYYITGFVRTAGDYKPIFKTVYRNGKKIELRYSFSKKPFGKFKVSMKLSEAAELPALVVRYGMGTLPVYDGTGTELCEIPSSREKKKSFAFEIKNAAVKHGMKGRLFFKEKQDKEKYQLMLEEGCSSDLTGK